MASNSYGKSGHWARQCPNNSNFAGADGKKFRRSLPCRCGAGSSKLFTSNTLKNPGRNFYRCPANDKSKCQFFKWVDEVNLNEFINVPLQVAVLTFAAWDLMRLGCSSSVP